MLAEIDDFVGRRRPRLKSALSLRFRHGWGHVNHSRRGTTELPFGPSYLVLSGLKNTRTALPPRKS